MKLKHHAPKDIDKNHKVIFNDTLLVRSRELKSNDNSEYASEDAALNYLASILVGGCLELQNNAEQSN